MKVTVNLSVSTVKGVTEYLKEVYDNDNVTKYDIIDYINGLVDCTLHCPRESVSDYVSKFENQ
jgi:hypothetical protein